MSNQRSKSTVNILIISAFTLITSCSFSNETNAGDTTLVNTSKKPVVPSKVTYNKIDNSAVSFKAKYGTTYEISGNVIAKYKHFDLAVFSKKTIPELNSHLIIYELTAKGGFAKFHITCDPRKADKKHFCLEDLHFYYHSNATDDITIYMPPQLVAAR